MHPRVDLESGGGAPAASRPCSGCLPDLLALVLMLLYCAYQIPLTATHFKLGDLNREQTIALLRSWNLETEMAES